MTDRNVIRVTRTDGSVTELVEVACEVVERRELIHEPLKLRVIADSETVDLAKTSGEFVNVWVDSEVFHLTAKPGET